jgi:hypothetical protein
MRRLAALLLAPLLASCQPPDIRVHAAFLGGALAFVAADRDDADSSFCWKDAAVIDDQAQPVWQFSDDGLSECRRLLPLFYGVAPDGSEGAAPAAPLEPGRLYILVGNATAQVFGAFSLSRAGNGRLVHNVDPDSPIAVAIRDRWWERPRTPIEPPGPAAGNSAP